jgi:TrmH family RNA methyltransferase
MTKTISSRQNAIFQRVRDAMRDHAAEIVLEGPKMVDDALAAGWKAILIARAASVVRELQLASRAEARSPHEAVFDDALFKSLSDTKTSQGVLALFARPAEQDVFARKDSIVVALDGVQDPGNVGTIMRLAAAFDAAGVALLPGCADPFSPKAIRASAGAVLSVPIARINVADLDGRKLFAADGTGAAIDPPARDGVIIFGSEGAGVSEELRSRSKRIAIATSPRVESLNVAAAAAILLSRSFALRRK